MTEQQLTDVLTKDLKLAERFHDLTTARPPKSSISEQLAVFERAGAELRKRMQAERQRLITEFEQRLAEYEATVRATIIDMKAAHQLEVQTLERMVKRFETLG